GQGRARQGRQGRLEGEGDRVREALEGAGELPHRQGRERGEGPAPQDLADLRRVPQGAQVTYFPWSIPSILPSRSGTVSAAKSISRATTRPCASIHTDVG